MLKNVTWRHIDECTDQNGGCSQTCTNTVGSYNCSCSEGSVLDVDGHNCTAVDECASLNGGCEQTCVNTGGSYHCLCGDGYRLNADGHNCDDIDECLENPTICGINADCINGHGFFDCVCSTGYVMGAGGCQDVDECRSGDATCDVNAFCANTVGTYRCVCLDGFTGDGKDCQRLTTSTATATPTTGQTTSLSTTSSSPVPSTTWYSPTDTHTSTSTLFSTRSTTIMETTSLFALGGLGWETTEEVSTEHVSIMTTIPPLTPSTAESTPHPRVFMTTQEFSTQTSFLAEEDIPALMETLDDKVKNFRGSLEDRKELLKEVTDGTSSILRSQGNSRQTVAMETTFDLSLGVTDEVKDLIDVDSPDMSPVKQLEQKKKEQERLKSRMKDETMSLLHLLEAAADKLLEETAPEGNVTHIRSDGVLTAVMKAIPDVGTVPIDQDIGSIILTEGDSLPQNATIKVVVFNDDPFVWSEKETQVSSPVVVLTITADADNNGGKAVEPAAPNITVNLRSDVVFGITTDTEEHDHDTETTFYRKKVHGARSSFPMVPSHDTNMKYHAMYITEDGQVPMLSFSVDDVDTELQVYVRIHDFPTEEEYDYATTVKPPDVTDYDGFEMPYGLVYSNFSFLFVPEMRNEHGWVIVGVKTKVGTGVPDNGYRRLLRSATRESLTTPPRGHHGNPSGFTLQTAAVSCLMWEIDNQAWNNNRCKVGTGTDEKTTGCTCDMAFSSDGKSSRLIVGSSFLPIPNSVDFTNLGSNFEKLSSNSTVFATIIVMWMAFLVAQLLILRSDIKSQTSERNAVADNFGVGLAATSNDHGVVVPKVSTIPSEVPSADYVYVVSVRTGAQPDAGTTSVVGLIITGSEGRTAMVTLNPAGLILARGGDTYHIMTTPASIGELQSVQVWHDSSGKGAMESLFIDNITVWDVQTSQGFLFPCYTWLSANKDDCRTMRTLKAVPDGDAQKGEHTLPTFSYLLYDEHLLLSAVCNSGVRHFSRAQRLVCCLTQITLWMLGSAMWYGVTAGPDIVLLDTGVVTLRLSDLFSSAATSFTVSLPVYVILVPMFCKQLPFVEQVSSSESTRRFPYKKMAWILAILTSVSSSFFVIVYSLQFGAKGSQAWLKDFVLTFMLSTFLLEPIQIFLVSYAQAVIIRPLLKPVTSCIRRAFGIKAVKKEPIPIGVVHEYKDKYKVPAARVLPPKPKKADHDPNWPERMTQGRDILVRLVLLLIFSLTYFYIGVLDTDINAYYVRTSLQNSLLPGHEEVTTVDGAWEWLSSELMPSLHPERGYSGKKLRWLDKQFPTGTNAFRIGPVRLERTTFYPDDPIDSALERSGSKLYPELTARQRDDAMERLSGVRCSHIGNTSSADDVS
ncbi:uncharacterized protein LOC144862349 [Branchiostoma floridae x Branchiostoma japonicum]